MGKKVKKALGGVVKVATLGAAGPGGWGSKAVSALTGGLLGGSTKLPDSGAALAQALTEQANRAQNANADLSLENVATVETAGTANAMSGIQKKRRNASAGGLAASLGINVG